MRQVSVRRADPQGQGHPNGHAPQHRSPTESVPWGRLDEVMKAYTVVYERDDDGVLIASIKDVPECHSYGRSLVEARKNIHEALEVWLDREIDTRQIREDWSRLVGSLIVKQIEEARELQEKVQRLPILRKQLAAALKSKGFSTRDAGHMLGIAHQRVHQYTNSSGPSKDGNSKEARETESASSKRKSRRVKVGARRKTQMDTVSK